MELYDSMNITIHILSSTVRKLVSSRKFALEIQLGTSRANYKNVGYTRFNGAKLGSVSNNLRVADM